LPSKLDDRFKDSFSEYLSVELYPAPVRDRDCVLEADLEQILELGVARRSSVLELLQGDIGDDQAGSSSAFTVTLIMLVVRPRLQVAPGKDEPIFSVVSCRYPVQLDCLLDSYKYPVLLPPSNQPQRENSVTCISDRIAYRYPPSSDSAPTVSPRRRPF
jgi:hypothetical protein